MEEKEILLDLLKVAECHLEIVKTQNEVILLQLDRMENEIIQIRNLQ